MRQGTGECHSRRLRLFTLQQTWRPQLQWRPRKLCNRLCNIGSGRLHSRPSSNCTRQLSQGFTVKDTGVRANKRTLLQRPSSEQTQNPTPRHLYKQAEMESCEQANPAPRYHSPGRHTAPLCRLPVGSQMASVGAPATPSPSSHVSTLRRSQHRDWDSGTPTDASTPR
jgi:hypothetical protein